MSEEQDAIQSPPKQKALGTLLNTLFYFDGMETTQYKSFVLALTLKISLPEIRAEDNASIQISDTNV